MATQLEIVTDGNVGKGLTINADKLDVNIDNATVVVKDNGKLAVPGAEMEVIDIYSPPQSTDTHFVTTETKWLRHVQTGAVWQAEISTVHERGAARDEELTSALVPTVSVSESTDTALAFHAYNAISAVDGATVQFKQDPLLIDRTAYATAEEFNNAHLKGEFTSTKRFSTAGDQALINETNFEAALPTLPFGDKTVTLGLHEESYHSLRVNYSEGFIDPAVQAAVQKLRETPVTLTYEITNYDGIKRNGTYTTERGVDIDRDIVAGSLSTAQKEVWTAAPVTIDTFFGRVTINFTEFVAEQLTDHL